MLYKLSSKDISNNIFIEKKIEKNDKAKLIRQSGIPNFELLDSYKEFIKNYNDNYKEMSKDN